MYVGVFSLHAGNFVCSTLIVNNITKNARCTKLFSLHTKSACKFMGRANDLPIHKKISKHVWQLYMVKKGIRKILAD